MQLLLHEHHLRPSSETHRLRQGPRRGVERSGGMDDGARGWRTQVHELWSMPQQQLLRVQGLPLLRPAPLRMVALATRPSRTAGRRSVGAIASRDRQNLCRVHARAVRLAKALRVLLVVLNAQVINKHGVSSCSLSINKHNTTQHFASVSRLALITANTAQHNTTHRIQGMPRAAAARLPPPLLPRPLPSPRPPPSLRPAPANPGQLARS